MAHRAPDNLQSPAFHWTRLHGTRSPASLSSPPRSSACHLGVLADVERLARSIPPRGNRCASRETRGLHPWVATVWPRPAVLLPRASVTSSACAVRMAKPFVGTCGQRVAFGRRPPVAKVPAWRWHAENRPRVCVCVCGHPCVLSGVSSCACCFSVAPAFFTQSAGS